METKSFTQVIVAKRKKIFLIVLLLLLSTSMVKSQSTETQLTKALQTHYNNSNLPGFCVAIVNEKGVLYQQGFGYSDKKKQTPFTTQTIQNLGSTSKAVLGMIIVKAIQDGKLSYDAKINDYLPFNVVNPYHKETPILVRHLVTHTSSILDTKHYGKSYIAMGEEVHLDEIHQEYLNYISSHKRFSLEDFLFHILNENGDWYKKKNFIKVKPGKPFEYANLNAALAGLIVEKATQKPLEAFSQESIFAPLGMNSTTWSFKSVKKEKLATRYFPAGKIVPNYGLITYPDGGLYSNVEDLNIFLQELIKAFIGNSTFLTSAYAKVLLPGDGDAQRTFIGMGAKSRNIGHAGSDPGVQTDIQFNADTKVGRVILSNVNAQDNSELYLEYRKIHDIVAQYEKRLVE